MQVQSLFPPSSPLLQQSFDIHFSYLIEDKPFFGSRCMTLHQSFRVIADTVNKVWNTMILNLM